MFVLPPSILLILMANLAHFGVRAPDSSRSPRSWTLNSPPKKTLKSPKRVHWKLDHHSDSSSESVSTKLGGKIVRKMSWHHESDGKVTEWRGEGPSRRTLQKKVSFTGVIWPRAEYDVYMGFDVFRMSDDKKVRGSAKPDSMTTGKDGEFEMNFTFEYDGYEEDTDSDSDSESPPPRRKSSDIEVPDKIHIHIFGHEKQPHVELDIAELQWDKVYIFDFKKSQFYIVAPRKVDGKLEELEERDKPKTKIFSGIVWPAKYNFTLYMSPEMFDLDKDDEPVKRNRSHPKPVKAETDRDGHFEVELEEEMPAKLHLWVINQQTDYAKSFVLEEPKEDKKYAFDMRKSASQEVEAYEDVRKKGWGKRIS